MHTRIVILTEKRFFYHVQWNTKESPLQAPDKVILWHLSLKSHSFSFFFPITPPSRLQPVHLSPSQVFTSQLSTLVKYISPIQQNQAKKKEQMGQRIPSLFVKPTGVRNIVFSLIFLLGSNASAYLVIVIVIIHGQIHLSIASRCLLLLCMYICMYTQMPLLCRWRKKSMYNPLILLLCS